MHLVGISKSPKMSVIRLLQSAFIVCVFVLEPGCFLNPAPSEFPFPPPYANIIILHIILAHQGAAIVCGVYKSLLNEQRSLFTFTFDFAITHTLL